MPIAVEQPYALLLIPTILVLCSLCNYQRLKPKFRVHPMLCLLPESKRKRLRIEAMMRVRKALMALALLILAIGIANPMIVTPPPPSTSVSVVFCIDRSGSMQRGEPPRIEIAKRIAVDIARRVLSKNKHVVFAVVSFAGRPPEGASQREPIARVEVEPTSSLEELERGIEGIRLGFGTSLYTGLKRSIDILEKSKSPNRFVIVITDGASEDDPLPQAMRARDSGIIIHAIGVSSNIGEEYDPQTLSRIASITGGVFVDQTRYMVIADRILRESLGVWRTGATIALEFRRLLISLAALLISLEATYYFAKLRRYVVR